MKFNYPKNNIITLVYLIILKFIMVACTDKKYINLDANESSIYDNITLENFEIIMKNDYDYDVLKDEDYLTVKKLIAAKNEQPTSVNKNNFTLKSNFIGTAFNINNLSNKAYLPIFKNEFSSVTFENALKFGNLSKHPGIYNWENTDKMLSLAKTQKKRVHGHVLAWDRSDFKPNPQWLYNFKGTPIQFDSILKNHIFTVLSKYKRTIKSWDVVNEAFDEHGANYRPGIWFNNLGIEWVEKAFKYAEQATNGEVSLFYNDYHLLINPVKLDKVLNLLDNIRKKGIKVDGIGLQGHLFAFTTISPLIHHNLRKIVNRGYKVHISELDISLNLLKNFNRRSWWLDFFQRIKYFTVTNAYQKIVPNHLKHGITFWQFSDADNWLTPYLGKEDWPCIYDKNYLRKPAYTGFEDGLNEFWRW